MSAVREQIEEAAKNELDERAEEEFGPQNMSPKNAVYDAARRRLDDDWVGRIAILISFMATIFVGMAVSFLNEQKILTTEGILIIVAGGFIYVGFRLFVVLYNFIALKLQHRAIELDIKEAEVRKIEAETDAYKTLKEAEVAEKKLLFIKNQNRLDQKLHQDLKLRIPFFQEAQKNMMNLFARDDIVAALQVPPTFVEAVEHLDDILLKRSALDMTVDKMNARIADTMVKYDDICRQTKENNELLNQLLQRDAELAVKWRETDLGLKQVQQQVASLTNSIDTLMEMFSDSTVVEHNTDPDPDPKPDLPEPEPVIDSIVKKLEKLPDEEVKEILEKSAQVAYVSTPVCEHSIPFTDECTKCSEEGRTEEESLPPPPS